MPSIDSVTRTSFTVLEDTLPDRHDLPAFMVTTKRGFLPRSDPVVTLPLEFAPLESILQRMPITTASGKPGLLASGKLGTTVIEEFPQLLEHVEKYEKDLPVMNALYRDYAFLASAYLLEPCNERFVRGEPYGLGRDRLPASIALPMVKIAEITGFKPFMEYAGSYALYNYRLADPNAGLEYSNLRLIRAFEHGLDPSSSEAGFVLVHVAMVTHSGELVSGAIKCLDGAERKDRELFDAGLQDVASALDKVNKVMNDMWTKSRPNDYTSFRTFIFGITGQSMFPKGVVYEGVSDEPVSFRGESGANDSMIPLADNLLLLTNLMPSNPLTSILRDFRAYRPGNHRQFLEWVHHRSTSSYLRDFALADPVSALLYLQCLDQVRDFRWRHWCFTREYILKKSSHPTATGGSPIVTWLPNQLFAVLDAMIEVEPSCKSGRTVKEIMDKVRTQKQHLNKEVEKYCKERKVDMHVS